MLEILKGSKNKINKQSHLNTTAYAMIFLIWEIFHFYSGTETGNCVMVETHACGVNYADICIRLGIYKSATEFVGWPI